jgi:hypothetical protein
MSVTECTITEYLTSKQTLAERIRAIEALIDTALLSMADSVNGAGFNISTYELDDGQVKIKTGYRSIDDVSRGIAALETMKVRYENRLYGRSVVLRDVNSFR